jgi:hypothetical protein
MVGFTSLDFKALTGLLLRADFIWVGLMFSGEAAEPSLRNLRNIFSIKEKSKKRKRKKTH